LRECCIDGDVVKISWRAREKEKKRSSPRPYQREAVAEGAKIAGEKAEKGTQHFCWGQIKEKG